MRPPQVEAEPIDVVGKMMVASNKNTTVDDHPLVFISSFYREEEHEYAGYRDSPLWKLRQELAALNDDTSFLNSLPLTRPRRLTWVAEKAEPALSKEPDRLAIMDRLVEVLKDSELYVCILADRRRGSKDHGSLVEVQGEDTAVSYFEVELYAAAMYDKKPELFVLEGFDPGPRLRALLKLFGRAIPDWRNKKPQKAQDILADIRGLIRRHCSSPPQPVRPLRQRLVEALCRDRLGFFPSTEIGTGLLFLNGALEKRPLPQPERVEMLIKQYRQAQNIQKKLNRLWLAVRELMPASYRPADVQQLSVLKEFLPYWDCVLGDWAAAAAWHGWHGHLYAGTVAPLNSQAMIRSQNFRRHPELQPQVILPPDGALASAYYSIAGLLGQSLYGWKCLWRAGQHVRRAIETRSGPSDNLLAIRGSIRLRMGYWPGAISDFKEMLRLREAAGAPPHKIADALMHLGFAYAFCPFIKKGRELLYESVKVLSEYPNDPNLPRARRKLAFAYRLARQSGLAEEELQKAESDALRLAAYDQLSR